MSTPIVEQIAVKLEEAINAIKEANGFNYDLTAVRPKRLHFETDFNRDRKVVIAQGSAVKKQTTTQTITWLQEFIFQAMVLDSDMSTETIDTRLNKIRADIEKQLTSSTYIECGGLAEFVHLKESHFIDDPDMSATVTTIDVEYTTDYDDPYTAL